MSAESIIVWIEPRPGPWAVGWRELWAHRELFFFLVWRDVKVRYKQTVLGAAWALLQPAMTMVVFTFVFGRLAGLPSNGVPYPIFALAGLLPWLYVSSAVGRAGLSVVNSANLVSKVYFPRLLIPLSAAAAPLVDLLVGFGLFAVMMTVYGVVPTWRLVLLPILILYALVVALAIGICLSAMNVRYRDITHLIPFFVQTWMFVSPVAYPASMVPVRLRWIYEINPLAGLLEGFRWCLIGGPTEQLSVPRAAGGAIALLLLVGSVAYFHRTEDTFADVI